MQTVDDGVWDIYREIENRGAVVIFGASDIGRLIEAEIRPFCENMDKHLCFADNSYKKWDAQKGIMRPEDVALKFPDAIWLLASDKHNQSMFTQLIELGVGENNIIRDIPENVLSRKQRQENARRLSPQKLLTRLEVDITHHCNLNCAGCSAFSPLIADPLIADFDAFKRDMKRLSCLLDGRLSVLHLMGGEPLLHPQIGDFAQCARTYFPDTAIRIVSNGILLAEMPDAFWAICRESRIIISVTRYPIKLNYAIVSAIAESHGVDFEFFSTAVDKTTMNIAFDPSGKQNPCESFTNCNMANFCVRLRNGKLSTCSLVLNIEFFNNAFGTSMHPCPDDYIDIHTVQTGRDILDFLSKPIPFCRFCAVQSRTYDNPWRISSRDINEWVATI